MSTYTSEPGTRLAGRYRLVDQASTGAGWTYWKATDETLARAVTVLTFAPGFPRVTETVTAARAASRLNDSRFAQVFDVEDSDELAYVVLEWVTGETLIDLLAEGPIDPPRATFIIMEAAQALAAAHRSGQPHLRLDPSALHWTPGGGVKIVGLGIDAALAGAELTGADAEAPELIDARDLARLLYAALTGYWPGPPGPGTGVLPPAPTDSDGEPCTPRQVSAEVPANIDSVACRALFQQQNRQGPPLTSPAELAEALSAVAPRTLVPPPSVFGPPTAQASGYQPAGSSSTSPYAFIDSGPRSGTIPGPRAQHGMPSAGYRRRHPDTERSVVTRSVVSVVIVLVLVAIGVTAWAISQSMHHTAAPPVQQHHKQTSSPSAAATVLLKPLSAAVYNPDDTNPGSDDPGEAQYALGGTADRFWHTSYYFNSPQFGHLKKGAGLILDMGKKVKLSQIIVKFGDSRYTYATIEIGNSASPSDFSSFTPVANSSTAAGATTFNVNSQASGRYVVIWITQLPPLTGNEYQTQIYDVTLHGTPV